jgi:hypothetical protein
MGRQRFPVKSNRIQRVLMMWRRWKLRDPVTLTNTPVKDLECKDLLTITFTIQTSSKS